MVAVPEAVIVMGDTSESLACMLLSTVIRAVRVTVPSYCVLPLVKLITRTIEAVAAPESSTRSGLLVQVPCTDSDSLALESHEVTMAEQIPRLAIAIKNFFMCSEYYVEDLNIGIEIV